jgi:hypothetical protein
MLSSQERLTRFEKDNRHLFLAGCFFVFLAISFWIVAALNREDFVRWLLQPWAQEKQILSQLKASVPSPSPREKMLLDYCKTLIMSSLMVIKALALQFIVLFSFANGCIIIGFSFHQRRVLALAREALEKK